MPKPLIALVLTALSLCPPLMTGCYANRAGVWHVVMGRCLLHQDEVTMAEVFQAGGYKTAMFGTYRFCLRRWPEESRLAINDTSDAGHSGGLSCPLIRTPTSHH